MDMSFSRMFLVGVLVGLVGVGHGRMVVLVLVGRHEMRDVFVRPVIVGDVDVLVCMELGIVMVGCRHSASSHPESVGRGADVESILGGDFLRTGGTIPTPRRPHQWHNRRNGVLG